MGHYDNVRYTEEARKEGYTEDELRKLEQDVKKKGKITVYDDFDGMKKTIMTRDSDVLSITGYGSMFYIYYDPDKIIKTAKHLLTHQKSHFK